MDKNQDNGLTNGLLIGMVSLGCPKNLVDGESMLGLLRERGYSITPDADQADFIIVNTCGFIDSAKRESIAAILEMADKKATGKCRALIVAGCLSERYRDTFFDELPEADAILGTGEYGRVCEVVGELNARYESAHAADFKMKSVRSVRESSAGQRIGHLDAPRVLTNGAGCVYIKIAEGCDNNCSYCVIPSVRGPFVSRPKEKILAEARRLAADRDIEAVLTAQDTTLYGGGGAGMATGVSDGRAAGAPSSALCELLEELAQIPRVRWIRLLYCYPDRIGDELVRQFRTNLKLARYIDMPVQHASDKILRAMGRRYSRAGLLELIDKLRGEIPGIVLRTTVMTGFPGEGDKEFAELADFIARARFERLGVFAYSREEGTPAAAMANQVPKSVARRRRAELLRMQYGIMSEAESARLGREYEAIVEAGPFRTASGAAPRYDYRVRTYAEAPEIDGYIRVRAAGRNESANAGGGAAGTADKIGFVAGGVGHTCGGDANRPASRDGFAAGGNNKTCGY